MATEQPAHEAEAVQVWGMRNGAGPVHEMLAKGFGGQSRCGKRPQIRHRRWAADTDAVTCPACKSLAAKGQVKPYKSRKSN